MRFYMLSRVLISRYVLVPAVRVLAWQVPTQSHAASPPFYTAPYTCLRDPTQPLQLLFRALHASSYYGPTRSFVSISSGSSLCVSKLYLDNSFSDMNIRSNILRVSGSLHVQKNTIRLQDTVSLLAAHRFKLFHNTKKKAAETLHQLFNIASLVTVTLKRAYRKFRKLVEQYIEQNSLHRVCADELQEL